MKTKKKACCKLLMAMTPPVSQCQHRCNVTRTHDRCVMRVCSYAVQSVPVLMLPVPNRTEPANTDSSWPVRADRVYNVIRKERTRRKAPRTYRTRDVYVRRASCTGHQGITNESDLCAGRRRRGRGQARAEQGSRPCHVGRSVHARLWKLTTRVQSRPYRLRIRRRG